MFRHQFLGVAWRGVGGARHRGMVQDRLPAFWNGDALISVDQLEISEADVQSLLDEQCGVILCFL